MFRFVLLILTIGAAAGIGFFFGRQSGYPSVESSLMQEARAEKAESRPDLRQRKLSLPIVSLKSGDIHDTFHQARGSGERIHEATDIMAPRGTPVVAMDDGVIQKLFHSKPGGVTIYLFDNVKRYCFYYAHLDRYAEGLREGMNVRRGDMIGYVGSTGNADPGAPHLHLAVLELGPEKKWWEGNTPIDPYPVLMELVRRQ